MRKLGENLIKNSDIFSSILSYSVCSSLTEDNGNDNDDDDNNNKHYCDSNDTCECILYSLVLEISNDHPGLSRKIVNVHREHIPAND